MPSRKFIGLIFILIGLLANEVTIALFVKGWYAFYKVKLPWRLAILTLEALLITIGWLILKGVTLASFARFYRDMALILFNVILLLTVLFGGFALKDKLDVIRYFDPVLSPFLLLQERPKFMESLYPGRSLEEIREILKQPPNMTSHPVLEFMETPTRSKHYNVGFENMRYSFAVNEDNAATAMNDSTWVFGGSTAFGHNVSDDDTIAAYLNRFGGNENLFINFGVQSYFQNNEIEKLLLLLKKGWRPKQVIFLDGLNDINRLTYSRFHPAETPGFNPFGFNFSIYNFDRFWDTIQVAIQKRFPADPERLAPADFYEDVYQIESPYHRFPAAYYDYFFQRQENLNSVLIHPEQYVKKLVTFYRLNLAFLQHLGRSFGFSIHVFFQPMGHINKENQFIKNLKARRSWVKYKVFSAIVPRFREHLRQNPLPHFYDISDADKECPKCYVDVAHYSPKLNAIIAQRILERLDPGQK